MRNIVVNDVTIIRPTNVTGFNKIYRGFNNNPWWAAYFGGGTWDRLGNVVNNKNDMKVNNKNIGSGFITKVGIFSKITVVDVIFIVWPGNDDVISDTVIKKTIFNAVTNISPLR